MEELLLPMMLLARGTNQKALFTHILPAMIPAPASLRVVIAMRAAEKGIQAQAAMEEGLVRDAIKAARFAGPDQLKPFPALDAAFSRLPASVRADPDLFPAARGGGDTKRTGADT